MYPIFISKYIKQVLVELKGEINSNAIIGEFYDTFNMDKTFRGKFNKEIADYRSERSNRPA